MTKVKNPFSIDCFYDKNYNSDPAVDKANANAEKREGYSEVFLQIINLRNDIISRISHTEPGSVKLFYKKLRADFNAEVDNVFKKLEELSK